MPPKGWKKSKDSLEEPENTASEADNMQENHDELPQEESEMMRNDENGTTDDSFLPKKDLFRIDEVARYLDISESSVRRWLDHGHLEGVKVVGSIRVKRESILRCIERFIPKREKIA